MSRFGNKAHSLRIICECLPEALQRMRYRSRPGPRAAGRQPWKQSFVNYLDTTPFLKGQYTNRPPLAWR